ncbi:uncharacterized protein DS421_7g215880 [Arachis hypogaea]|nr:uncharacterized protein DS421_7g215880 [Arachis hypogaea]
MYACNYQSLDRDYFAPLSTPPLKFVFFSSLGHLLRVVFFEKEVMEAVTHIYTETYTSHLRQKIRKETKKEKKIFAEDYGLKGDPRLLAISQAIRVVSQVFIFYFFFFSFNVFLLIHQQIYSCDGLVS